MKLLSNLQKVLKLLFCVQLLNNPQRGSKQRGKGAQYRAHVDEVPLYPIDRGFKILLINGIHIRASRDTHFHSHISPEHDVKNTVDCLNYFVRLLLSPALRLLILDQIVDVDSDRSA